MQASFICNTVATLSPMRSGKLNSIQLNWTKLDRSVQFSGVEFSFPLCSEPATSCDDRRRFLTVKNRRRPSTNLQRPSTVVAARRRFSNNFIHLLKRQHNYTQKNESENLTNQQHKTLKRYLAQSTQWRHVMFLEAKNFCRNLHFLLLTETDGNEQLNISNDRHCVDWPIHESVSIVKNLRRPPISSPV